MPRTVTLDHDGGALIYRRYRHLFPSEVRAAVSMLDRMVAERAEIAEIRWLDEWSIGSQPLLPLRHPHR